ncbi:ABC transporter substrate-binding protein [Rubellimicrobium aerolatum]|uniref:ABC transporter substrate-binding protein n=1 Tax=Rubellimicrobium aerolatum TaxID=490979 RepID=A0ABW0S8F8_9RHOB|nr:ABC transporter substrate-binding protein [Rubellimicrobium aerolatum]MBP1804244.1 peptide/nickel transport system substrate-binding protein [Rubellimicrobium aerolatum]
MTPRRPSARAPHPAALMHAGEVRAGRLSRREFLTRATALGVASGAAYGLLGLEAPAGAQDAATPVPGGTLRMNMETRALKDPRTWDWSEIANFARGWLDYLAEYQADGTLRPMLLESWEANADATEWVLSVRQGVTWNNGDPFTAEDVAHNLRRWCDGTVEGNSMAARFAGLVDPATNRMREEAVEILDAATVRLRLSAPDIAVVANMADYPAAVVHRSYDGGDPAASPIGTGPYLPEVNEVGVRQVLVRNPDHAWWGTAVHGGPWLDRIEYIDYGTDPAAVLAAAESGEIDATYQTNGDFIDIYDSLGWAKSEAITASTLAVRFNQRQPPYDSREVRRALQMAVDNAVVLELGYSDRGLVAENHHVCPIHPEYAELPPPVVDPAAARAALEAAGHGATEFELVSLDDSFQAATCDAVAAQIRDAGIAIRRTVLPGSTFWNDWLNYPFSATQWAMRPLGVQTLNLAYKSGVAWNETAFANAEFDAALAEASSITDAEARRAVMARLQRILQDEGVVIQPYWLALYRHATPRVRGAEQHPIYEHHHYKWWMEPAN